MEYAYVWRTLLRAGVPVAGGSDAPVEPPEPLRGMADAMEHQLAAKERMSFQEALSIYTLGGAYAARAEGRLGSLEVGKEADLVVLSCRHGAQEMTAEVLRSCHVEKVYVPPGRACRDLSGCAWCHVQPSS